MFGLVRHAKPTQTFFWMYPKSKDIICSNFVSSLAAVSSNCFKQTRDIFAFWTAKGIIVKTKGN